MAKDSKIEWCHHTANLWWGCEHVSPGCDNCYAETLSKRWGFDIWGREKPRRYIKSFYNDLNLYQHLASRSGEVHRVFVGSMMDIFEKPMPIVDSRGQQLFINYPICRYIKNEQAVELTTGMLRDEFFKRITQGLYPNLIFLLLTKRPSNINKYIPEAWKTNPPQNVMYGTSPVNQATADILIPQLLKVKGKRFLSIEPLLAQVDLREWLIVQWSEGLYTKEQPLDWIITGGESGHHKRLFNCDWARVIRDQCKAAQMPFFMKQIDKVQPIPEDLLIRQFPHFNSGLF